MVLLRTESNFFDLILIIHVMIYNKVDLLPIVYHPMISYCYQDIAEFMGIECYENDLTVNLIYILFNYH
jgi:hypothetical protein